MTQLFKYPSFHRRGIGGNLNVVYTPIPGTFRDVLRFENMKTRKVGPR